MKDFELDADDVVITGRGIISPIGNDLDEVTAALRSGRSGIVFEPAFAERNFSSQVCGKVGKLPKELPFPVVRALSMSRASLYSSLAAWAAVAESGLQPADCERDQTGVVIGTGASGLSTTLSSYDKFKRDGCSRRLGGHVVDRTMASTCAANATVLFKTRGVAEALSGACATGLQCIGQAYRLIANGYQDTIIAGSAEEDGWEVALGFDAMRVLCADSNAQPERASRPFHPTRSGFVVAGGAAVVVLERWERARRRGARPLARIAGYGSASDGSGQMIAPSVEGQAKVMAQVLAQAKIDAARVDYVNLHGTSTMLGDSVELHALGRIFGTRGYLASSSKSQMGHAIAAAGSIEVVLSTLMLEHQFAAPTVNLDTLDAEHREFSEVLNRSAIGRSLRYAQTNNFGFGNVNASMLLEVIEA